MRQLYINASFIPYISFKYDKDIYLTQDANKNGKKIKVSFLGVSHLIKLLMTIILIFFSFSAFCTDFYSFLESINSSNHVKYNCFMEVEKQTLCENPYSICEEKLKYDFNREKSDILKKIKAETNNNLFEEVNKDYEKANTQLRIKTAILKDFETKILEESFDYLKEEKIETMKKFKQEILIVEREAMEKRKKVLELLATVEFEILRKFGKTLKDIEIFFSDLKKTMVKNQLNQDFKQKILKISFMNSHWLSLGSKDLDELIKTCGFDGMNINASYFSSTNSILVCPGFLLDTLLESEGDLNSLTLVLGHEIGHSVDSNKKSTKNSKEPSHKELYQDFILCMEKYYIRDKNEKFGNLKDIINQLETKGIPNLKKFILLAQAKTPQNKDEIFELKQMLEFQEFNLWSYKNRPEQLASSDSLNRELIADYQSIFALHDQLELMPLKMRKVKLKNMLRFFCPRLNPTQKKVNELLWNGITPGVHPPKKFRIENYLRSPKIRSLLGCSKKLPQGKPWCSNNN